MELKMLADELNKYLVDEQNGYFYCWVGNGCLVSEINWGDWKHDHWRFKHLVKQFCEEKGLDCDIQTEVTEEDGSDCYSARHYIYFKNKQPRTLAVE